MKKDIKPLPIKANIFWNSFGSLVNLGCSWLITVFIVRFANDLEAAGIYALAMSIYATFAPIAQYRTYVYQISDLKGEFSLGEYLSFRLFTSTLALALIVFYTYITNQYASILIIILFSLYKLASLQIDVLHANMQKNKRMDYLGQSEALQGVVSLIIFVIAFKLTGSLSITLLAMFVGMILVGILYDLPRAKLLEKVTYTITPSSIKKLLLTCLPIVVGGIAASAAPNLPRQALNYLMGSEALGAYGTLAAPVALIQMGASYIYNPLLTYFVQAYEQRSKRSFQRLLLYTLLGILALMILASIFILLFGKLLLSMVYGEKIVEYLYLLQPLILCAGVTGFMWFLNDLTQALRLFKATTLGNIASLLGSVASMFPLILLFNLNGVTFANMFSALLAIFVMGFLSFKRMRRQFSSCIDGQ